MATRESTYEVDGVQSMFERAQFAKSCDPNISICKHTQMSITKHTHMHARMHTHALH